MTRAVVAALAAIVLAVSPAVARTDGLQRVHATATISDASFASDRYVRLFSLWNRDKSARPIGHAWEICFPLNIGSTFFCNVNFVLPGGKLQSQGVFGSSTRVWLPVISATGVYSGLTGSMRLERDFGRDDFKFVWLLR